MVSGRDQIPESLPGAAFATFRSSRYRQQYVTDRSTPQKLGGAFHDTVRLWDSRCNVEDGSRAVVMGRRPGSVIVFVVEPSLTLCPRVERHNRRVGVRRVRQRRRIATVKHGGVGFVVGVSVLATVRHRKGQKFVGICHPNGVPVQAGRIVVVVDQVVGCPAIADERLADPKRVEWMRFKGVDNVRPSQGDGREGEVTHIPTHLEHVRSFWTVVKEVPPQCLERLVRMFAFLPQGGVPSIVVVVGAV